MPANERLSLINEYRAREMKGDKFSDDELREVIRLIRAERVSRVTASPGGSKSKTKPMTEESKKAVGVLDDLLGGL